MSNLKTCNASKDRSPAARWTEPLAKGWVPISSYFLANYHRLDQRRGFKPFEVVFLIHLLSFKWGSDAPFPSQETLALRMGMSSRRVRQISKDLEDAGYITVLRAPRVSNRYIFDGLFNALEELMTEDGLISEAA